MTFVLALTFITATGLASGDTITVGPEHGEGIDHTAVQDALNVSVDGDTVFIMNGTYFELLTINSSISLVGESASLVVINGGLFWDVIVVMAENVTIANITIENSSKFTLGAGGIHVEGSYCTITGCNIIGNRNGIIVKDALEPHGTIEGVVIVDCHFESNQWGVNAYLNSSGVSVSDCTFLNNSDGVQFWASDDGTVRNCTFAGNTYAVDITSSNGTELEGLDISDSLYHGIQMSNGNGISARDCIIDGTLYYGLSISNCYGITLEGVALNNSSFGLSGEDNDHFSTHTIENCTIDGEPISYIVNWENVILDDIDGPIYIIDSKNVTVESVNRTSLAYGLIIVNSTDVNVVNVTFYENSRHLRAIDCTDLNILNCTFIESVYRAISINGGHNVSLTGNYIQNGSGIILDSTSEHALIDNRIVNADIHMEGDELDHYLGTWMNNTIDSESVLYRRDQDTGMIPTTHTYVYIVNCSYYELTDTNVSRDRYHLYSYFCDNITIFDCIFSGNETVIEFRNSSFCLLRHNTFDSQLELIVRGNAGWNPFGFDRNIVASEDLSIRLQDTHDAVLGRNIIDSDGGYIEMWRANCSLWRNEINGCRVSIIGVHDNHIMENRFSNASTMIWTYDSSLIYIEDNVFTDVSTGISIRKSSFCRVVSNNMTGVQEGIYLEDTDNCTILANDIEMDGGGTGIGVDGSLLTSIRSNICQKGYNGISIGYSTLSEVVGNECMNNGNSGIWLRQYANASDIRSNDCIENEYGILLHTMSFDNTIKWNHLLNNTEGINGNGTNNVILNNTIEDRQFPDGPTRSEPDDEEDTGIQIEDLLCVISLFVFVILMLASVLAPKKKKQSWDRRKERTAGPGGPKVLKRTGGAGVPVRTKKTVTMRPKRDSYLKTRTEFPGRKKR